MTRYAGNTLGSMSKAETLELLAGKSYLVPQLCYFSAREWDSDWELVVRQLRDWGRGRKVAVRSSAMSEDAVDSSQAGKFRSILNVPADDFNALRQAMIEVRGELLTPEDQILIQEMVSDVSMAGVLTTYSLADGTPYYVINYDDTSGQTDTVTAGKGNSKTVYIYRDVKDEYFDSIRLREVVQLAKRLEQEFNGEPLDIEFATDSANRVHLLQVRRICSDKHWVMATNHGVNTHITHLADFVRDSLASRRGLLGSKTTLGVMTDWNPAEMIGIAPKPLAFSLYRELITRRVWSEARGKMGYRKLPPVELMLSIGGRPYIDIRASFNSFLPEGLSDEIGEKLVDAWLDKLDANPGLHDKVEFEIVHTVAEPGFRKSFTSRYPDLMLPVEFAEYEARLVKLTRNALAVDGSLDAALRQIESLKDIQDEEHDDATSTTFLTSFDVAVAIGREMETVRQLGTLPFAIIARHAFIAETLLRSAVIAGALSSERTAEFKQSLKTISRVLSHDFHAVLSGAMDKQLFLRHYGHLRPGTYDILSPSYAERPDLFNNARLPESCGKESLFVPTNREKREMDILFLSAGLEVDCTRFLEYAAASIAGREYAKFIFTRHVSRILGLLVKWGERISVSKQEIALLSIADIMESLYKPMPLAGTDYFRRLAKLNEEEFHLGRSFELAYLIRSEKDVYIVPQYRSAPNFITRKRICAPLLYLHAHFSPKDSLQGKIICIESADPGYDWIFTRSIAGLITRYGGANSHMAIRCAEYDLPAAIGCGDLLFEKIRTANSCLLDCNVKSVTPMGSVAEGDIV